MPATPLLCFLTEPAKEAETFYGGFFAGTLPIGVDAVGPRRVWSGLRRAAMAGDDYTRSRRPSLLALIHPPR
jgi:hypothetical protein